VADTPRVGKKVKTFADRSQEVTTGDIVDRSRLVVNTRRWFLSRIFPKKVRFRQACVRNGPAISRRKALGSFLCSGGFIPAPLQRRESLVDLVGRKSFWIESVAKPLQQFVMSLMLRVADRLQQVVEAGDAAAVFGRPVSFTR
jgi:hypothetical protein